MINIYRIVIMAILLGILPGSASAIDTKTKEDGRRIFIEQRCYTCHTINAEADAIRKQKEAYAKSKGVELKSDDDEEEGIAPDLSNVGKRVDAEFLKSFLKNPKKYFKDTLICQRNAKKKYRKRFKGSSEEFEKLVTYISTLKYDSYRKEDFESCLKEDIEQ